MSEMPEIDWRSASREERQILYRFLKAEMDSRNMTLFEMLKEALGTANVGQGYDANMRSGRFNRKHAYLLFDWLEQKNPQRAASVAAEILAEGNSPAGAWQELTSRGAGSIAIIEHPERQELVKFADEHPVRRIALGKPFFLQIHCPADGFAIGFQQKRSLWYPLPLGREAGWVSVHSHSNDLPCRADGRVDPLVEETEPGPARFLILFSTEPTKLKGATNPVAALSRQQLDAFAEALANGSKFFSYSSSLIFIDYY